MFSAGVEMRLISLPVSAAKLGDEMVGQQDDVAAAVAQRRNGDRETRSAGNTDPRGTCPSPTISSRLRLVAAMMRRSTLTGRDAADALEGLLLQHAQQLGLHRQAQFADLVEEDRAAVGHLEPALAHGRRRR